MAQQDELSITTNGRTLSGWKSIRVTRGIERVPSDFSIEVTEKYPDQTAAAEIRRGSSCQVKLGDDLVLTGYIDRTAMQIGPASHSVHIMGRSKLQDLVDASAEIEEWKGQRLGDNFKSLAEELCRHYGISVVDDTQGTTPRFETFTANLGESSYDILERVARSVQVVLYDDPSGNLVFSRVTGNASPLRMEIREGLNVQFATTILSGDQRFSEYVLVAQSVSSQSDQAAAMNVADWNVRATAKDVGVTRKRRMFIVGEQFQNGESLKQQRVDWEANRRYGRSYVVKAVVDSWRDASGRLWEPNTLVAVHLPTLSMANRSMLLSEVTYVRNAQRGTAAELTLMPPEAFAIQPTSLSPVSWDQIQAIQQSGAPVYGPVQPAGTQGVSQ